MKSQDIIQDIDAAINEASALALKVSQQRCAEAVERVLQSAAAHVDVWRLIPTEENIENWVHWTPRIILLTEHRDGSSYYEYPEDADPDNDYIPKDPLMWETEEYLCTYAGREYYRVRKHWFYKGGFSFNGGAPTSV